MQNLSFLWCSFNDSFHSGLSELAHKCTHIHKDHNMITTATSQCKGLSMNFSGCYRTMKPLTKKELFEEFLIIETKLIAEFTTIVCKIQKFTTKWANIVIPDLLLLPPSTGPYASEAHLQEFSEDRQKHREEATYGYRLHRDSHWHTSWWWDEGKPVPENRRGTHRQNLILLRPKSNWRLTKP